MTICVYSAYVDNIYKSDFLPCYWCLSEESTETLLTSPLLLITRYRVGGGNCGLRTHNML